ncbi:MAG: DUF4397 domain-containing protein [Nocardioidaceae bacterium]
MAALAALLVVPGGAASAAGTAQTYVVQGVPGASVDVTVDGKLVQSGVAAKQVLGPLDLSPGRHTLSFATADWTVSHTVDVTGSQDVVLHWPADAADEPVVTVFANDVSAVRPGEGRLMVAHTAVVPPADIVADGKVLFSNIANGEFVSAVVPAATYHVAVVPTGGGAPLLGPVALPVKADALTRVFAIGAPRNGSMDAVVQVLPVPTSGGAQPAAVHAGEAGLVAPDGRVVPTARGMSGLLSLAVRSTGLLAWWPHG